MPIIHSISASFGSYPDSQLSEHVLPALQILYILPGGVFMPILRSISASFGSYPDDAKSFTVLPVLPILPAFFNTVLPVLPL
jgi:hypothetical protein